jgi:acyl carrier protein
MPLTPNGKIDRKSLDLSGTRLGTGVEYAAPTTGIEVKLTGIWKEILKLERIGINDSFFDLGATSMDVIRLNNILKERVGIDVPVISIYRYFTIKSFSRYLTEGESTIPIFEEEGDRLDEEIKKSKNRLREKSKRTRSFQ